MKKLILLPIVCLSLNSFADEGVSMGLKDSQIGNVEKPAAEDSLKSEEAHSTVKSTIEISEDDFRSVMANMGTGFASSFDSVDLTSEDKKKIQTYFEKNKSALFKTYITEQLPEELDAELSKSNEKYKKLTSQEKKALLQPSKKVASELLFEKVIKADATLGYLLGSNTSTGVAELNARLLNLRTIKLGDYSIENVNMQVQVGYPKMGFVLLSGKVTQKDSPISYEGQILSVSGDMAKQVGEFSLANARVNYEILPWLEAYGGLNVGVRSYADGTVLALDPRLGVEVNQSFDDLKLNGFAEAGVRIAEGNTFFNCGGSIGLNVIDNDNLVMDVALMNRLSLESNPRQYGNSAETFNGITIQGRF